MQAALEEAKKAITRDEVPIGAVVVNNVTGEIVAAQSNRTIEMSDPSAHAEMLCIRELCGNLGMQRAPGHTLYVTLEPCAMCAGAISFARFSRVIFGAIDPKGGGILHGGQFYKQTTCHHRPTVEHGIMAEECGKILKDFFQEKRRIKESSRL